MKKRNIKCIKRIKRVAALVLTTCMVLSLAGCGRGRVKINDGTFKPVADISELQFPLKEKATLSGMISYPANTESDPNKRTIFKRLQEQTNVEIDWVAIQGDQWGDKISLNMSDPNKLTDFVFTAGFSDSNLLKYGEQGAIIPLEEYIDNYMPNLKAVFDKYPEYRTMSTDVDGHIWALPWIEQLGSEKTAIQTIDNMSFINKSWLDFLKLDIPQTVDEFEKVLIAFRDNADALKKEFNIDGSVIPMSCILNDGGQDPAVLINGFGEGYGDADKGRHIAVTDDKKVICSATQEGYKKGIQWLNKLYKENLIDKEAFTHEWSTYVSKGKSGRCVVTSVAQNPALVCAWLDQMYAPLQSPQNNWGTYGESDEFDIFEMSENENGEPMLKHAPLGDASPVEVREAEAVGGPLAVLDEYYGKYVTCPDDAQYRLDWIKEYYSGCVEIHIHLFF